MIELVSSGGGEQVEMVDLFSIDGTVYQVPAKPRVNVALQFLNDLRTQGEAMANMLMLEKLLGAEGYKALSTYDALTPENLRAVTDAAAKLTLGMLEEAESGNSDGGSLRSVG